MRKLMRKLTDEEIKKELNDIEQWPTSSQFVYMKNLYDGRTGYFLQKSERGDKPISLVSPKGNDPVYPDLKAMIEAGWVVD